MGDHHAVAPWNSGGHLLVSDGHGKDTLMECRQHQVGAESPGDRDEVIVRPLIRISEKLWNRH